MGLRSGGRLAGLRRGDERPAPVTEEPGTPRSIAGTATPVIGVTHGDTLRGFDRGVTPFLLPGGELVVPVGGADAIPLSPVAVVVVRAGRVYRGETMTPELGVYDVSGTTPLRIRWAPGPGMEVRHGHASGDRLGGCGCRTGPRCGDTRRSGRRPIPDALGSRDALGVESVRVYPLLRW